MYNENHNDIYDNNISNKNQFDLSLSNVKPDDWWHVIMGLTPWYLQLQKYGMISYGNQIKTCYIVNYLHSRKPYFKDFSASMKMIYNWTGWAPFSKTAIHGGY